MIRMCARAARSPVVTRAAVEREGVPKPTDAGVQRAGKDLRGIGGAVGAWTLKFRADAATDFKSLPTDAVDELYLVLNYTIA